MKKIKDILRLRFITDISYGQIGKAVDVPKSTVSDYCRRFEITKYSIEEFLQMDEDVIYQYLFPEKKSLVKKKERPLPDVEYIHREIGKKGVTFELLWQEYKEQNPNGYGLSQFKEYYYQYKKRVTPTMRQTYIPGHQMFVDYSGLTLDYIDRKTGEILKSQIFVTVLGASGCVFVHGTPSQKQEHFIKSHILAYEFYGGAPKVNVPDNLKSAVIFNNKKKGIVINESYAELCRYYNCTVEPARVKKPQDKGKVEQAVQGIQRWILAVFRNRRFFSVDEINQAIAPLIDKYNNKEIKLIGKSRYELFEEEKKHLQPLPANRFIYKEIKIATVDISYHVQLLKCFYSVPFKYIKERVEIKYSTTLVEVYHKSKLIATHPRLIRANEKSTLKEHMPKNHQYQNEKMNPDRLLNWATRVGENARVFVKNRLEGAEYPVNVYKSIIAILSKAKIYGNIELDLALGFALSVNATSVKSIESILSKKLYLQPANNSVNPVMNNHENIRGKNYFK